MEPLRGVTSGIVHELESNGKVDVVHVQILHLCLGSIKALLRLD